LDCEAPPVRGISTVEAFLWLGPFAAIVYLTTFAPALFYATDPLGLADLIPFQFRILEIQRGSMAPHPYQSLPWQWMLDLRPVWYFYEPLFSVWRGVLLIGNPVVMWAGLLAVPVALVLGIRQRCWGLFGAAAFYLLAMSIWLVVPKPVMFFHYYLVPSLFLCVALAGVLDRLWLGQGRYEGPVAVFGAAAFLFLWFYPILSAAPLDGRAAFNRWMWLDSWR
jgi:dolichyl-phosphate-mannose--protein O-mannosyl transferase